MVTNGKCNCRLIHCLGCIYMTSEKLRNRLVVPKHPSVKHSNQIISYTKSISLESRQYTHNDGVHQSASRTIFITEKTLHMSSISTHGIVEASNPVTDICVEKFPGKSPCCSTRIHFLVRRVRKQFYSYNTTYRSVVNCVIARKTLAGSR